jgi:hypothetical protein
MEDLGNLKKGTGYFKANMNNAKPYLITDHSIKGGQVLFLAEGYDMCRKAKGSALDM